MEYKTGCQQTPTQEIEMLRHTVKSALPLVFALVLGCHNSSDASDMKSTCTIELTILGNGQDAGKPQIGVHQDGAWTNPIHQALATSIALIDRSNTKKYLFDATPDIKTQLYRLHQQIDQPDFSLHGVFLTHAHIGHYLGLAQFGREAMGANSIPVYAMPKMATYLENNGPWSQLVALNNIAIKRLRASSSVQLSDDLNVTPLLVPHRDEYAETVGYRITYKDQSALYLPDIDSWNEWASLGTQLEDVVRSNDILFLDATFYSGDELPGRDMSKIPHPTITTTMARLKDLPKTEKNKINFIHMNHTNPALDPASKTSKLIQNAGFNVARTGENFCLD